MVSRLRAFKLVVVLVLLLVAGRLVQVQVLQSSHYSSESTSQLTRWVSVPALRGGIYDRDGNVLAASVPTSTVIADDYQIKQPEPEARALAPVLGTSVAKLVQLLHQPSGYVPLARQLSLGATDRVNAEHLPGITTQSTSERIDPDGSLAQPVLGTTYATGAGAAGLEYQYQQLLAGRSSRHKVLETPSGVILPVGSKEGATRAVTGSGVETTLDESLQYETERALGAEITASHAVSGTAIIMDVKTGQVLSMANLAAAADGKVVEAPQNLALTEPYEPGSVFKLVTFSAALQDGLINPDTTFSVPDQIELDGSTFHDDDPHPTEEMTATDILAQSSNIGTSEIAQELGEQRLMEQVKNLGFGSPTDLHFPGESGGILLPPSQWEPTDYVDMPIGQVDAATPMQVLDMMNSVADGGVLQQPKLVRGIVQPDGKVKATAPAPRRRVMSSATASTLLSMMGQVVANGTGTLAAIPGYDVAGKTGTAQIPNQGSAGYISGAYMGTFAGIAPANHPVLSAMVVLNRPTPIYGGSVAAPVFSQIMGYALHHYDIPTSPGASTAPPSSSGTAQAQDVT